MSSHRSESGRRLQLSCIDTVVYVAHPELLGIEADEETYSELHAAFACEVERASAVTILAGYFNPEYVIRLLKRIPQRPAARRRTCRVRVGIGIDPGLPLMGEWLRLSSLKSAIKEAGFKNTEVFAIRDGSVHFHTKVYGFIRKTQRSWYVGSANPGKRRHEMMVRVSGRHDALFAYVNAALSKGIEVDDPPHWTKRRRSKAFSHRDILLTDRLQRTYSLLTRYALSQMSGKPWMIEEASDSVFPTLL